MNYLKNRGYWVRGVDLKYPEYEHTAADEFIRLDLRDWWDCNIAIRGDFDEIYHLAADMGGIGYITQHLASITRNNILIDTNMLEIAKRHMPMRYFYSSSACVYPQNLQDYEDVTPLREQDAYPALAEPGYGWEKLWAEQLASYYCKDFGVPVRVARFHNVFGPLGTYDGGKEKAPAALCRKIATLHTNQGLTVWGDGEQTRSFLFIRDCVEGIYWLTKSSYSRPVNIGSDRAVSVNELVEIIGNVADKKFEVKHDLSKPQGVRGRNSDNTLCQRVAGWRPHVTLERGLEETYWWIHSKVRS